MVIAREESWFADIANFIARNYLPRGISHQQKKKFFSDIKYYYWDKPYLFLSCVDNIIRRCVFRREAREILHHCYGGPTRGHYGAQYTAKKVFDVVFYWLAIFKDKKIYVVPFIIEFYSTKY